MSPGPVQSHHGAQGDTVEGRGPGLYHGGYDLLHGVEARVTSGDGHSEANYRPDMVNSVASTGNWRRRMTRSSSLYLEQTTRR